MTRTPAGTWGPAAPRPLRPCDLDFAPELAALAIVQDALHTALVALYAAHPTLDDFAAPNEPPSLRRARRLVAAASSLGQALERYRATVYDVLAPPAPSDDDLLF